MHTEIDGVDCCISRIYWGSIKKGKLVLAKISYRTISFAHAPTSYITTMEQSFCCNCHFDFLGFPMSVAVLCCIFLSKKGKARKAKICGKYEMCDLGSFFLS